MTMNIASLLPARAIKKRWIALLVASILLHLLFIKWADGRLRLPSQPEPAAPVVTAELHLAPPPAAAPAEPLLLPKPAPKAPKPKPNPRPAAPTAAAPEPVAQVEPEPVVAPEPEPVAPSAPEPVAAPEPAGIEAPGTSAETAVGPVPPPAAASPADSNKVSPPPSAELKYDVQALRDGNIVYGSSKMVWQADAEHYTVSSEASVLFFTVLSFKSEGSIDGYGLAPLLYSEKRFRKAETNTHFNRERNTISFSASTLTYPRQGGEQDRASLIWQFAGFCRANSRKIVAGAVAEIFVAGVRDAETWPLQVVGFEEITVGSNKTNAWHVVRLPRHGSFEQKIDFWLDPQQEWYPVKLRYTENNGEYLDMTLSSLTPGAPR
jgi:outer membrane biosynthesis protein TonB